MTSLGKVATGETSPQQKKGWKKVFGGGNKSAKKDKGGRGKKKLDSEKGAEPIANGTASEKGGMSGKANGQTDGGFVGMGQDGVWISRKNFMKA